MIAFDFDGVICDSLSFLCQKVREIYKVEIYPEQVSKWRLSEVCSISYEQEVEILREYLSEKYYRFWKVYPNADRVLKRLSDRQKIIIISQRYPHQSPRKFLDSLGIDYQLETVKEFKDKLEFLKRHKIEYFVEDRPESIKLFSKEGIKMIKAERPYNKGNFGEVFSFSDWLELEKFIEKI